MPPRKRQQPTEPEAETEHKSTRAKTSPAEPATTATATLPVSPAKGRKGKAATGSAKSKEGGGGGGGKQKAPAAAAPAVAKSSSSSSSATATSAVATASSAPLARNGSVNGGGTKSPPETPLRTFFNVYRDEGTDVIGPAGVEKLCTDLAIAPDDVAVLVLAWRLNCATMGSITWDEWSSGLTGLKCDNVTALRAKLTALRGSMSDKQVAREIHRYAFKYILSIEGNEQRKCIERDSAVQMLAVILGPASPGAWKLLPEFTEFLLQSSAKVINRDQWDSIFEFAQSVSNDLSTYDETAAWPVLLDDFVEWVKTNKKL
eukprot:m.173936 g.173936  ORF g.173936 m.173936 type:complete len:317 (+) comp17324_c3_seq2:806-1756(+)